MMTVDTDPALALWLTRAEAATRLGLKPKTLANWATRGEGPPFTYLGPCTPRYKLGALVAWAESRSVASTTEGDALALTARSRRQRAD
jgi:hypothetical protein